MLHIRRRWRQQSAIESLFSVSEKMLWVIAYVFEKLEEVTPLMLQKLLYFIQGIHSALYDRPIFIEDCRAWIHGLVYPEVYELFRNFKYNPIDDARFALLKGTADALTEGNRSVYRNLEGRKRCYIYKQTLGSRRCLTRYFRV